MKIFSASQVRQWDAFTIENEPIASIDLMERAARQCTAWLQQHYPHTPIAIFCGKGNNGGDGLAIARHLAAACRQVRVYILEVGAPGSADFKTNLQRLQPYNVPIVYLQNQVSFPHIGDHLIVECLFGSGINRGLQGLPAALVQHIQLAQSTVVSIDLPAGLFADETSRGNVVMAATHTLTFQAPKLAFFMAENEACTGQVTTLDIGLHTGFLQVTPTPWQMIDETMAAEMYCPRNAFSHKGTFGHALVLAGSRGKMGAAILATTACLRSGAGLVTAAVPEWGLAVVQSSCPEAMAVCFNDLEAFALEKYAAAAIGPGIGTERDGHDLLKRFLHDFRKPTVLDADALNLLALHNDWWHLVTPGSILTPHPKEFERLFGAVTDDFARVRLALQKAVEHQVYIVLKGHKTLVACPNGEGYFNSTGNAGMATGGSGDVLTGLLAGLRAQGYQPKTCCLLGVYLHGLAGDVAATHTSQEAMIAGDLPNAFGRAFQQLAATKKAPGKGPNFSPTKRL